jgi:hypothetical protein
MCSNSSHFDELRCSESRREPLGVTKGSCHLDLIAGAVGQG